ncbi:ANTAR domain-containing protein [Streptomyces sp. NPDC051133]|uniref:ANTAR domain-containing protein n=1 Tax=Streptomyces sp. NPDC051133 TaxID=3155521 RepID=UPI00343057BF
MDHRRHGRSLPELDDRAGSGTELRDEIDQLREAVWSHAVIDQAVGIVMALGGLTPEQGFAVLKDVSHQTDIALCTLAEAVVDWAPSGELPYGIRVCLAGELNKARATPGTQQPPAAAAV